MRVRWAPVGAITVAALSAGLGVVAVALSAHAHQWTPFTAVFAALGVLTGIVGLLIALRQPTNGLGWCLLGGLLLVTLSNVASTYSVIDFRRGDGHLPLGELMVLLQPGWSPGIVLMGFTMLIFPDGGVPRGVTRWATVAILTLSAGWIVGAYGIAVDAVLGRHLLVDAGGNLVTQDRPTAAWAWVPILQKVVFACLLAALLLWGVDQVRVFRRAAGDRRLQLKWLYSGAVLAIAGGFIVFAGNPNVILSAAGVLGVAALPATLGMAILKYRLYDIDRIISRTLAYALVTAVLVGVYVGMVALTTQALPFSSPVGVAVSTFVAAALFTPLRRRVQRVVDRRFNRARYDTEATVAAFVGRLRGAVTLDAVCADLLAAVTRAVEPSHLALWIPPGHGPIRPGAAVAIAEEGP